MQSVTLELHRAHTLRTASSMHLAETLQHSVMRMCRKYMAHWRGVVDRPGQKCTWNSWPVSNAYRGQFFFGDSIRL